MDKRILDYHLGKLNKKERIELLKETFVNEGLKKQMIEQQQLQSLLTLHSNNTNTEEGKIKLRHLLTVIKSKKQKYFYFQISKYAAILIVAILSTWSFSYLAYNKEVTMQEAFTPAGQRAELVLPDGTKVWLNSNSRLIYASTFGKERRVKLLGEAFFEVYKDKSKPFIVSTHSGEIQALGTQFNVFSYLGERLSIFLTEGSVKVYKPYAKEKGIIMKEKQLLTEINGTFHVVNQIDESSLLWKRGIYSFEEEKLGVILQKLELYFDTKINIKNSAILDYKYTGKFRQKDGVMEILKIIQRIHHFKIRSNPETNEITLY